ncbi:antitoxin Xre/MbcA/ParS toxin-binding domain-containing protein [Nocardioides alkalitolerans]|uniref:antitoxin Xre/MbcA/ParS toxin-binding domain-containing protein n=1 Tax=Nocardioides alkalitolerans TaxID=281714 RepID=UPI0006932427|nr:antitoxin Xre/MbcA/ParS toxin-binding domain-containing protein [Nocardioides alkalitolerans]
MTFAQASQESASNQGVARVIARAREQADLSSADLARIVGVGERQIQNWAAGRSGPGSKEKLRQLLDLQYVLDLVREIYEDDGAVMWLHARNRMLGGGRPLDLLAEGRTDEVINLLDRIADGNH